MLYSLSNCSCKNSPLVTCQVKKIFIVKVIKFKVKNMEMHLSPKRLYQTSTIIFFFPSHCILVHLWDIHLYKFCRVLLNLKPQRVSPLRILCMWAVVFFFSGICIPTTVGQALSECHHQIIVLSETDLVSTSNLDLKTDCSIITNSVWWNIWVHLHDVCLLLVCFLFYYSSSFILLKPTNAILKISCLFLHNWSIHFFSFNGSILQLFLA